MNKDYKILKDKYGEKFAKFCRTLFPTLLEKEGLLSEIILSNFEPNKYLYDDIKIHGLEEDFKNYILSFVSNNEKKTYTTKTVRQLLNEAGYNFFECKTEEEIQEFKRYYATGEELCTFNGGRLNTHLVFWVVKKDVEEIKREDFDSPKRQDRYGTSVMSIQFYKTDNRVSIKNRYNHTVQNPDATFGNNLENIIPGLTNAFEREYNLTIIEQKEEILEIPNYVKANNKKIYKYNYRIENDPRVIYYCPNNIIIDNGEVIILDKSRYVLLDYYIYDKLEKRMKLYINEKIEDAFLDGFKDLETFQLDENNKRIETKFNEHLNKESGIRIITITPPKKEPITIELDKFGRIISYINPNIIEVKDKFMSYNKTMKNIELPNVTQIGSQFLFRNFCLRSIKMPKIKKIKDYFLYNNRELKEIYFPVITTIGDDFLSTNQIIEEINFPNLIYVKEGFLFLNDKLKKVNLPNLLKAGDGFLAYNLIISPEIDENLQETGRKIADNPNLKIINVPNLINKELLKSIKEILSINNPKKEKNKSFIHNLKIFKYIKARMSLYKNKKVNIKEGVENDDEIRNNRNK